jgi:hypothetical protein
MEKGIEMKYRRRKRELVKFKHGYNKKNVDLGSVIISWLTMNSWPNKNSR